AVYLDGGLRAARAFVRRHLKSELRRTVGKTGAGADAKTRLQELVQSRWRLTPSYRIVSSTGPAHAKEFTAEVLFGDALGGRGGAGPEGFAGAVEAVDSDVVGQAEGGGVDLKGPSVRATVVAMGASANAEVTGGTLIVRESRDVTVRARGTAVPLSNVCGSVN